jgi:uncharacterized membrane protein YeaQ/YmgE (transglycosylase-associated protein family)
MAVLGWIALGLVTAVLASGLRRGRGGRRLLAGRYATGMVGALVGGLVAVAAGVGPFGDFFHTGIWLIALGGAVLALVVFELTRSGRASRDALPREAEAGPAGGPEARARGSTGTGEAGSTPGGRCPPGGLATPTEQPVTCVKHSESDDPGDARREQDRQLGRLS